MQLQVWLQGPEANLKLHPALTIPDTGLCLPGSSGLKGSVSSGEPAPISAGCLGAESADGCDCC